MKTYFLKRDSKGVIRLAQLELVEQEDGSFVIIGETGTLTGKKVPRPVITITKGKVKRSIKEQAELQFNSVCSDYLDKGYKSIEDLGITDIADFDACELIVPKVNTDAKGMVKPMLAKSIEGLPDSIWNNKWIASRKLDGVRCLIYFNGSEVLTTSRGGKEYNTAAHYIISNKEVINFFKSHPDIILDGELYIHGKPLSYISGLVRLKTVTEDHKKLNYWIYDIVDETLTFEERLEILNDLKQIFNDSSIIKIVDQVELIGKQPIMNKHNEWVSEGFEGLVLRDPKALYKCGARDKRMCKVKVFQDDEFEIIDIVDGLRDEDMCFLMKTKEGYEFKAKPVGDRELKQWYRDNIENIKGKMGTVKFFGYTTTKEPVPNLPVFKSLRNNIDL